MLSSRGVRVEASLFVRARVGGATCLAKRRSGRADLRCERFPVGEAVRRWAAIDPKHERLRVSDSELHAALLEIVKDPVDPAPIDDLDALGADPQLHPAVPAR